MKAQSIGNAGFVYHSGSGHMRKLKEFISAYLVRRRQKKDLLSMDRIMLNDLGISRADAERFAGLYKNDSRGIWRLKNERDLPE